MLSVLDQPAFRQRVSRLSVAEYHQLGEKNERGRRTELIRGIVIEKMSKSPLHGTIASILQDLITPRVPRGYCLRREEPLTLRDSEPEPDIAIVTGERRDYLHAHPTTAALAVEVAVTSPETDRMMAEIYAEAGVAEYWIVLPQERAIEVYRHPEGLHYREMRRYDRGEELSCQSVPGLVLRLTELFAGLDA
jgi:Uma2 family endonuclease